MTEPEWRQCGAVDIGRVPLDGHLFRCGLEAGHHEGENPTRHGNWQDLGRVQDPDGTGWAGRVLDSLWEQVTKEDPDAWRAPDDATRGETPPTGQVPEASAGWAVTGRGKASRIEYLDFMIEDPPPKGPGVSDASQLIGAIHGAMTVIDEKKEQARALVTAIDQEAIPTTMALGGQTANPAAVHAAAAHMEQANQWIEDAIQQLQAAWDTLNGWAGAIPTIEG